jgi:hypothetical protein
MDEYVNKQALLSEYDRVHVGPPGRARKLIEEAPAAEVVPVVRCKDCVLHGNCLGEDAFNLCGIEDPFCCCGKRKEAEGDDPN